MVRPARAPHRNRRRCFGNVFKEVRSSGLIRERASPRRPKSPTTRCMSTMRCSADQAGSRGAAARPACSEEKVSACRTDGRSQSVTPVHTSSRALHPAPLPRFATAAPTHSAPGRSIRWQFTAASAARRRPAPTVRSAARLRRGAQSGGEREYPADGAATPIGHADRARGDHPGAPTSQGRAAGGNRQGLQGRSTPHHRRRAAAGHSGRKVRRNSTN